MFAYLLHPSLAVCLTCSKHTCVLRCDPVPVAAWEMKTSRLFWVADQAPWEVVCWISIMLGTLTLTTLFVPEAESSPPIEDRSIFVSCLLKDCTGLHLVSQLSLKSAMQNVSSDDRRDALCTRKHESAARHAALQNMCCSITAAWRCDVATALELMSLHVQSTLLACLYAGQP